MLEDREERGLSCAGACDADLCRRGSQRCYPMAAWALASFWNVSYWVESPEALVYAVKINLLDPSTPIEALQRVDAGILTP